MDHRYSMIGAAVRTVTAEAVRPTIARLPDMSVRSILEFAECTIGLDTLYTEAIAVLKEELSTPPH